MAAGPQQTDSSLKAEANHYMREAWRTKFWKMPGTAGRLWHDGCVTMYGKANG